jgi:hypothetical protein
MYQIQFFSVYGVWAFWNRQLRSKDLDGMISRHFEKLAKRNPRSKLRIIDLNTGEVVYS